MTCVVCCSASPVRGRDKKTPSMYLLVLVVTCRVQCTMTRKHGRYLPSRTNSPPQMQAHCTSSAHRRARTHTVLTVQRLIVASWRSVPGIGLRPDLAEPLVGLLLLLQRHEHPQLVEQSLATPHSGASARPRPRGIRAVTRERVPRAARAGVGAVSVAIPACAIILAVAAVMVAQAVEGTGVSTAVNLAGAELSVVEGAPPTRRRARLGVLAPATQLIGDALAARLVACATGASACEGGLAVLEWMGVGARGRAPSHGRTTSVSGVAQALNWKFSQN